MSVRRWQPRSIGRLLAHMLGLVGIIAGWLSDKTPAIAVVGLVLIYVLMALIAGPLGRALGLPPHQPDEAYSATLDRWRSERRGPRSLRDHSLELIYLQVHEPSAQRLIRSRHVSELVCRDRHFPCKS